MRIHLLAVAALAVVALDAGGVAALAALDAVAASRPCDIYGRAGTPCVAAHSTVRALYASYRGPLYELMRADGATANVSVTAAGYADAAAQDAFCAGARTCVVQRIYDQSPMANHLAPAPASAASYGRDHPCPRQLPATPVDARKHPIVMGGAHRAYGAWFEECDGYRNDKTVGIATGNEEETIYMVTSGKRFNDGCCFVTSPRRRLFLFALDVCAPPAGLRQRGARQLGRR